MSRMEAEEEKKKMIDKFFSYAESPIMEWLSEYLEVQTDEVFPDYDEDSNDIGFQYKGNQYNAYLLSMGPNEPSAVSSDLLQASDDARKACSMLFDAVQMVMPSVVHTSDKEYADKLRGFHCKFDENTMSFNLIVVNTEEYKKVMAVQEYKKIMQYKGQLEQKLAEPDLNEALILDIKNRLKQADDLIGKAKQAYEMVTEEDVQKEADRCDEITKRLADVNKLYIVVEKVDSGDVDAINEGLKRLPVFGITYQDTEDETFTEKLKKEYALNE
jgi:hypothetical protein